MNIIRQTTAIWMLALSMTTAPAASADEVTDWNLAVRQLVVQSGANTPQANRTMAIVHTAIFLAANAVSQQYSVAESLAVQADAGTSIEAAVASAARNTLLALLPGQQAGIADVFDTAVNQLDSSDRLENGFRVGERAAQIVLNMRKNDGHAAAERYRPVTTSGQYVPTTIPAVPQWPSRQPWLMTSPDQFLPNPPPLLTSEQYATDLNEVRRLGAVNSVFRTREQTQVAKFWEATLPPVYHGVVHCVANLPGRSVTQNARLYAAVTRAIDDAMIAVFSAKYHFGFWRPITAIRNADIDGNTSTERDPEWLSFIATPMHPEYPCAHCVVAGTVGAVLKAEIGTGRTPLLSTQSDTAEGVTRTWRSIDGFVAEVSNARIYDGVHYRFSTIAGTAMGMLIGQQAAEEYLN
ncbi:MAG: vanadium-dependent haloperoxidase [Lysobacterales bacterium]